MSGRAVALPLTLAAFVSFADAQVVRRGSLRDADRDRLAALGGEAARHWMVDAVAPSGAVTRLLGRIELPGATAEERFAAFVELYGPLFDVAPGGGVELSSPRVLTRHDDGTPRHLRAVQLVHGAAMVGHGLTIELDAKGAMVCAHGIVSRAAAELAPATLAPDAAIALAASRLAAMGYATGSFLRDPRHGSTIVDLFDGEPHLAHRVLAVVRSGLLPLAVDVDAHDGTILRVFEDRYTCFGEGSFHNGGNAIPFETKNGKGVVFKDLKSAGLDKPTSSPLPEVGFETAVTTIAEDGSLFGRFAWVLQGLDDALTQFHTTPGVNHAFLGFPSLVDANQANLFDSTNCYFHLTKYALAMTKLAGPLPTDYAMPTVTNVPDLLNAFFSPQDLGLDAGNGFMAFGDVSGQTGVLFDDFSVDPTVMCHEYTHAIADFSGLDFGTPPVDNPNRAVNEAIADYFAASFFKDPRIGFPLSQLASTALKNAMGFGPDALRNLAAPKVLFDNLGDELDAGIPEEHAAGNIFGCMLWNVRTVLKQKAADDLILNSVFNWPQTLAEAGLPAITPANAGDVYAEYFADCAAQLVADAFVVSKTVGLKIMGAVLPNGCLGSADILFASVRDATLGGSFGYSSHFLGTQQGHVVGFAMTAGQTFDFKVMGNAKDGTLPDIAFSGPMNGLDFPNPAIFSSGNHTVSIKGVQVLLDGNYFLFALNDGPKTFTPQHYKTTIAVK